MPNEQIAKAVALVGVLFVTASAALWFAGIRVEPCWIALAALGGSLVLLVMQNFPAALIAPVIFMGNLKTEPAVGLDLRDPTFCALIALTLTILVWAARHTLQGDLSQQLRI